jgi:radical SAM superfamily enzyme YgiQ (UPF0313 family)
MKKVLLVNTNSETRPYPVPPIGLCMIAASLENYYETIVYDGTFDRGNSVISIAEDFKPDYIGLTIRNIDDMNIDKPASYVGDIKNRYAEPLRGVSGAPLILGGSGFSIMPDYYMKEFSADYGVVGEGEAAIISLLGSLDNTPGIGSARPQDSNKSLGKLIQVDQNNKSFADSAGFSEIDRRIDFRPYIERGSYPIQTKRGCSHGCVYCTYNRIEGACFRVRSAESVALEIEQAVERLGHSTFEFVDSTFNDPTGHAESICREIIARGIKTRLRTMGVNPANVDDRLMELMKEAGFAQIDCGADTASSSTIASYGKNFSKAELERAALAARKFDMPTMWFFIFGGPGETKDTISESLEFIDRFVLPLDMVHITLGMRIYPRTPLHSIAIEHGIVSRDDCLVEPRFYVSPKLGIDSLREIINSSVRNRPNCVPVYESSPPPEMMREAAALRAAKGLNEPMFRSLLRVRYAQFKMEV